jgi:hypothetical protein
VFFSWLSLSHHPCTIPETVVHIALSEYAHMIT